MENMKFRPANDAVGETFMGDFCHACSRYPDCEIWPKAMLHDVEDPEYPDEWISDKDGERCTAYLLDDQPVPPVDDRTLDMFGGK